MKAGTKILQEEPGTVTPEPNPFLRVNEVLTSERDILRTERDALATERNVLRGERDTLARERDILRGERDTLAEEMSRYRTWVPPGHYYSPIPSLDQIKRKEKELFGPQPLVIPGVDLNDKGQVDLFAELVQFYQDQPFPEQRNEQVRFYFENQSYSYADAIFLYSMIRYLKPKNIIEVGSAFSSCVTLDTNELFFDHSINCTFVEPYPDLFKSLVKSVDLERVQLLSQNLQDIPLSLFAHLQPGDLLFIDSTHVSKVDSDVNYLFFKLLPLLPQGVYIHIHDIFYPFEYPKEWIYRGMAWSEAYVLRAFLQFNTSFEIAFFNHYFAQFHGDLLARDMPLCLKNTGGSIWLKKIG